MNNEKNKRIEEILGSLDGSPKAGMPPFFYTRLKARMEAMEQKPVAAATQRSWLLRPAFAITTLVTVLLVNAFVLFQRGQRAASEQESNIQTIAAEYSLNDNSVVLFESNQDK